MFIVHSLTNVQNKNQTIKGKTPEWALRLSAPFSSPETPACSSSGHTPWLSITRATRSLGFGDSGLATSSTRPDVGSGCTRSAFTWVGFDCFLLLDQHWDPIRLSHAGLRGRLLWLKAVVRRRNALTGAMRAWIPPAAGPAQTHSLFLWKEAAQIPWQAAMAGPWAIAPGQSRGEGAGTSPTSLVPPCHSAFALCPQGCWWHPCREGGSPLCPAMAVQVLLPAGHQDGTFRSWPSWWHHSS